MKLSENTLNILKNFSEINSGIVLKQGNIQRTMSPTKTILAEVILEDNFPMTFGIYDLSQFLGNISTLNNPDLDFQDDHVKMSENAISFSYHYCSPNLVVTPPDKELQLKQTDFKCTLSKDIMAKMMRLGVQNNLTHLSFIGKNKEIRLQVHEKMNDTSNFATFKLNEYDGNDFIASFKTEHIKMIPDDYEVEIQLGAFAKLTNKSGNIKYFVALESK